MNSIQLTGSYVAGYKLYNCICDYHIYKDIWNPPVPGTVNHELKADIDPAMRSLYRRQYN